MHGTRNHGGVEPASFECLVARDVPVYVNGARRPSLADHRGDLAFGFRIHQHQRFAAQAVEILLDDAAHQQRGHAGIECIAALEQDAKRHRSGERVSGRDATRGAHHGRAQGRACRLAVLLRHLCDGTTRQQRKCNDEGARGGVRGAACCTANGMVH